jgi:hypothetical protein
MAASLLRAFEWRGRRYTGILLKGGNGGTLSPRLQRLRSYQLWITGLAIFDATGLAETVAAL